jgi:hypothetical protein
MNRVVLPQKYMVGQTRVEDAEECFREGVVFTGGRAGAACAAIFSLRARRQMPCWVRVSLDKYSFKGLFHGCQEAARGRASQGEHEKLRAPLLCSLLE